MHLSDCTTFPLGCHTSALLFPSVTELLCALDFSSDATALTQDALKRARHVYKSAHEDAHVVVEFASDSLIPKFLRVTLDTFWRARIDLCMHSLLQPQTHLPIFRSVFVYTSSRVVFEALDRRCDGHRGLPHVVLTSESVRHVSFLPNQLVDLFVKIMVKAPIPLCAREIRKRCEELACPAEDDTQVWRAF